MVVAAEDVTGDLYALWRVSEALLPRVADLYYDTNRLVAGADGTAGRASASWSATSPSSSSS